MTLNNFRTLTTKLGKLIHVFIKEVCSQYNTTELPHEMAVQGRREVALAKRSDTSTVSKQRLKSSHKKLNLSTYKYHALEDYPNMIAMYSTTNNSSTQTVSVFFTKHTN